MFLAVTICSFSTVTAQEKQSITGKLIGEKNYEAIPFAYIFLFKTTDVTLVSRTSSDLNGEFKIGPVIKGSYRLEISAIGYQRQFKFIDIISNSDSDAGIIYLQDTVYTLTGAIVEGERFKAKSEKEKTTFFITKEMLDASYTGTDILKLVPGIQIDIMKNISLNGSRDILIFVDGAERDRNFISQLSPGQIDKVEVVNTPSSNYDGNITGAINIILKKERDYGFSGKFYAEIPTSGSEMYIFPTYNLNYGFKKLNLYTSYNGEMCYLDINESTYRKVWDFQDTTEIISNQYVWQKNWSHKFHYGLDYFFSPLDQFNFYAFYNPYSREFDGDVEVQASGSINNLWKARKEDTDMNTSTFYSLYYRHLFNKEGHEIKLDISNHNFQAKNRTDYIYTGSEKNMADQTSCVKPEQKAISIKIDYLITLGRDLNLSTGIKGNFRKLQDRSSDDFNYIEKILAIYGAVAYKKNKIDLSSGLRAEKSASNLENSFGNKELSFLPYASFNYKITGKQNIQFSYKRTLRRPNLYQLNPYTSVNDPYSVYKGNPLLKPEHRSNISVEHSIRFNSNYLSSRLFYDNMTDVIGGLTFINDQGLFDTQVNNMGTIHQYGMQVSGALKLGIVTVNPSLRLFNRYTSGNDLAKSYYIKNRHNLVLESGLSAVASFKHDVTASFVFQYNSPKNDIQGNSFCDALYFLSLEKTFRKKMKAGIVSAIPFSKSFTYLGSEFDEFNFCSYYEGHVKFSFPFYFKLSYQFNLGSKKDRISHDKEEIDNLPKKGF
ncbi:MAG: hypothetical protein A2V64_03730 [Bacteroidetes bacterium RBG_13_43_22]|nr:MAG: hypothetical protein A2V64_03730 [Bacteroidetes bacterium RBG_13_43_22]